MQGNPKLVLIMHPSYKHSLFSLLLFISFFFAFPTFVNARTERHPEADAKNLVHLSQTHIRPYKKPTLLTNFGNQCVVGTIRALYAVIDVFNGNGGKLPPSGFDEDPLFMGGKDILYLGSKYYYKSRTHFDTNIINHFARQNTDFSPSPDFKSERSISISAGGDLMPYASISSSSCAKLWNELGDFFFSSDIVFANLETPIDTNRPISLVPELMLSDMYFNASPEIFDIFGGQTGEKKFKGYDLVSIANNHSLDQGTQGVLHTMDFLDSRHVAYTGGARTEEEQNKITIIERKGIKIAFLAYTYSLNKMQIPSDKSYIVNYLRFNIPIVSLEQLKKDAAKAREQGADIILLSIHGGFAYQAFPEKVSIDNYHKILDNTGIDIILATHPHVAQPLEKYSYFDSVSKKQKDGFIVYSLGDFIAYDIFIRDRMPLLIKMKIEQGKLKGETHTQLSNVEVKTAYMWGKKTKKGNFSLQLLDFEKLLKDLENNINTARFSKQNLREIETLRTYRKIVFPDE